MADSQAGRETYQRSLKLGAKDHFCGNLSKHRSQHEKISGKAKMRDSLQKKADQTPPDIQDHER